MTQSLVFNDQFDNDEQVDDKPSKLSLVPPNSKNPKASIKCEAPQRIMKKISKRRKFSRAAERADELMDEYESYKD
jgi:hypothetical protein